MENTDKILFPDDKAEWFVAVDNRAVGPMEAADVYAKIRSQEISWAHYVWRQGQKQWQRVCDVETFQAAVPQAPGAGIEKQVSQATRPEVKKAGKRGEKRREWFLYYNDSQFGPFSFDEVDRFLRIGKIHGRVHAWRKELASWTRLENIPEFEDGVRFSADAHRERREKGKQPAESGAAKPASHATSQTNDGRAVEMRGAPRRPLVARILMAKDDSVIVGVCRDISVGGMQVLTDRIPGPAGSRIKLNVSPSGDGAEKIEPFVAEGIVVRILEDGRGFSFRFDRLGDGERKAIEGYIKESAGA